MEDDFVKITGAAYKILDFFPDTDPLKNRAKEKALAILDSLTLIFEHHGWVSLKSYLSPEREVMAQGALEDIRVLKNYFRVAKEQGWINALNFLIITSEYDNLIEGIGKIKGGAVLPETQKKLSIVAPIITPLPAQEIQKREETKKEPVSLLKDYSERQKKILKILKGREKTQVSDIIKQLPDVTKRTIRRDLDDLLKRGEVVRVGEWNQVYYKMP
ncbi:MAG: DeoR family transcriptional regulator [bacterium]|nr:DeoR family transcriptional regulator [bacterium]